MADTTNTAEIRIVADSSGVEAGLQPVITAAQRAERAMEGVGGGATRAATTVAGAERSLIGSIQRTTAQMEAGSRTSARYYEVLAQQRGVNPAALDPYLRQLRQVEQAQLASGRAATISAGQTANAMRQLPAQLSDVVVSLQGGQNPLTVLLQQGAQVRDSFGSVGGAARAVGGQILGLVNPYTLAAVAVAGLGLAFYAGSQEARAYDLAIASTGNAAGTSAALMAEAAAETAKFIGSQSGAAETLAALVSTGQVSGEVMVELSVAALKAQRELGREVSVTNEEYTSLGKDPVKALADLIAKYHHVTAATYAQVKALQDEGKTVEAVILAQKAHADGITSQTKRVVENLGYIEAAWKGIKNGIVEAAGSAKDWFLSWGRDETLADLTAAAAKIQKTIDGMKSDGDTWGARKQQALLDVLNAQIESKRKNLALSQQEAQAEGKKNRETALLNEITNNRDKLLSREELRTRALKAARVEAAEAGLNAEQTRELVAVRAKEYADVEQAAARKREEAARKAAEAAKQQAAQIAEMAGLTTSFAKDWDFLSAQYKKGAISLDDLVAKQAKLLAQQPAMKEAAEKELKARKEADDFNKRYAESLDFVSRLLTDRVKGAKEEADKNEELARTYGMSAAAIAKEEVARLSNQLARAKEDGLKLSEIEYLKEMIKLRERSAAALASIEVKDANKKAAERAAQEWQRSAEQIGQALTDNLMRGGKSAAEYIKDLFRTMVLRPLIQPAGNALGSFVNSAMGMPAGAQATGGSGSNLADSVSALYNTFKAGGTFGDTVAKGVQTGLDKLGLSQGSGAPGTFAQGAGVAASYLAGGAAGIYGGRAISNGYAVSGSGNGLVNAGTAVGALVGGPIGAAIGGMIAGAVNRAFGMRPKEVTRTSIDGTFGADGFAGSYNDTWKQQGGLFRSNDSGITPREVDAEMVQMLTAGYTALKTSTADYIKTLGLNADWLMNRSQNLSVTLTGDAAKDQQAITDFFTRISDDIAREFVPSLTGFTKAGESASATLQRLATGYALVDTALESIGKTFGALGVSSLEARERLLAAAGGLDAFAANTAGFQQNFLSEAERNAPVLKSVTDQLAALGLAGVDTRDEFKQVVLGLDLTTEAGAKQYGALMKLQAGFAQVYPAVDAAAIAAQALADAQERANAILEQRKGLQDELDSLTMSSAQLLEKQRNALDESNRALFDQIQAVKASAAAQEAATQAARDRGADLLAGVDSAFTALQSVVGREKALLQEVAGKHQALAQALRGTLDSMSVSGQEREDRLGAQAQIRAALAIAKASGTLPDVDSLKGALSIVGKDSASLFSTQEEYLRDFYSTQADIADLAALTDKTLSVEEQSIKRLDDILASYQQQIDVLKGIDTTGLTTVDVLRNIEAALGAAKADPVASAGASLAKLYKELLGRAPDAGGLEFYKARLSEGVTLEQIRSDIMQSLEYKKFKGIPGFAGGGFFGGGYRIVGENGPELEATGPARIFNASQTNDLLARLARPAANSDALARAVARLSERVDGLFPVLYQVAKNTGRGANSLEKMDRREEVNA